MTTLAEKQDVEIRYIRFEGDMLFVELSDERLLGLPFTKIKWLDWLERATPAQRAKWSIEPYEYAVWWEDLDDGFELAHALSIHPLPHKRADQPSQPAVVAA